MSYKFEANQQPYKIESIAPANPPVGAEGSDWFHYVIVQGSNLINGYRQGSIESVTLEIEENVELLNERRLGKRGRVQLMPNKNNATSK